MIKQAKRIIKGAIRHIQKKAGLRIYRKVVNAQKWADWLVASGVPNAKTADELQVTIMEIVGDVQVIPETRNYVMPSTSGVFCIIGNKLCFAWYDYGYYDRYWTLREVTGCEVCHHSRAVLVLSDDPGDFQFSDEALLSVPASLVLDGESTDSMDAVEGEVAKSAEADRITPDALMVAKAKSLLSATFDDRDADPMQQAALEDLTHGKPVQKSQIMEDLGPDIARSVGLEGKADTAPVVKEAEVEKTAEVITAKTVEVIKKDTSRRTMYGWASVSTVDGVLYEDLHGDTISTDALHDICEHIVLEGQNAGGVEHQETPNKIAAAMVIDDDFAAALSDNFYFDGEVLKTKKQGLFIGYHYVDPADWEIAKNSPVEFSINGTAIINADQEA